MKLDNTIARVMRHPAPTAWNHTIRSTNKRSGPVISLGADTYRFYDDKKPRTAVTRYTATKAATMFLAYQRVYRKLKSWDLKPKKANLLYPDGAGDNNYLGFSDPACCVKIARNWFSHNGRAWRVREADPRACPPVVQQTCVHAGVYQREVLRHARLPGNHGIDAL